MVKTVTFCGCYSLFSRSVVSDSLWPHGLQHARLPCPSPSARVCSNSCPLSLGSHPTISSSVFTFSSCPQSFPVPGSFPISWFLTAGCQNIIGASTSAPSPVNEYSGLISFKIDRFDLLVVQGTLKIRLQYHIRKHQFFGIQPSFRPTLTSIHDYWRKHSFDYRDLCQQSDAFAF